MDQKKGLYTHVLYSTPKFPKWRSRRDLAPLIRRLGHAYYVPCLDILLPVASYSRRVLDLKVANVSTLHVGGPGFDSRRCAHFFVVFFFVLFCFFRKTNFHFLTDLKYTGRLIAGSFSNSIVFLTYSNFIIHKLALRTLWFEIRFSFEINRWK